MTNEEMTALVQSWELEKDLLEAIINNRFRESEKKYWLIKLYNWAKEQFEREEIINLNNYD